MHIAQANDFGRFRDERAMNLEELDGFIAALICGPSTIPPSPCLELNASEIASDLFGRIPCRHCRRSWNGK
jgi:hypothetical protein